MSCRTRWAPAGAPPAGHAQCRGHTVVPAHHSAYSSCRLYARTAAGGCPLHRACLRSLHTGLTALPADLEHRQLHRAGRELYPYAGCEDRYQGAAPQRLSGRHQSRAACAACRADRDQAAAFLRRAFEREFHPFDFPDQITTFFQLRAFCVLI